MRVVKNRFYYTYFFFFFKQKTAYEIKECDWSSDVCSSDLMTNLLMALTKFYSLIVGLYLAYINFDKGNIIIGILIILFGIAIITWVLSAIFSFISGVLMLIFRVDKKYFE